MHAGETIDVVPAELLRSSIAVLTFWLANSWVDGMEIPCSELDSWLPRCPSESPKVRSRLTGLYFLRVGPLSVTVKNASHDH